MYRQKKNKVIINVIKILILDKIEIIIQNILNIKSKINIKINGKQIFKNPKISIDKQQLNVLIYILLLTKVSNTRRGGRVGLWHQS